MANTWTDTKALSGYTWDGVYQEVQKISICRHNLKGVGGCENLPGLEIEIEGIELLGTFWQQKSSYRRDGGKWHMIDYPKVYYMGKPIDCVAGWRLIKDRIEKRIDYSTTSLEEIEHFASIN